MAWGWWRGCSMLHNPNVFLDRWRGGEAMLWEYSVSHRRPVIRVEIEGKKGNLYIRCAGISFICRPTNWDSSSLEIEEADGEYIVWDRVAGHEVRARVVELAENRKPVY
jgi:hypothetical protein